MSAHALNILMTIGFGLVAIAYLFLSRIFYRAWRDDAYRDDGRFRVVAGAMTIGKIGVFIWALNPLSQAFGGPRLPLAVMVLASVMVLGAAVAQIGSTAMGGDRRTLTVFVVIASLWTLLCIGLELAHE